MRGRRGWWRGLSDGTPLLLDKQLGEGHVLLLASGLENLTNDLPLHPAFVAFVDRSARYLSGSDRLTGSRVVESFVQLRAAESVQPKVQGASVEVIDPDGKRPLSLSEAATVQSFQLTQAGFLPGAVCEWEECAAGGESGSAGVGSGADAGGCDCSFGRERAGRHRLLRRRRRRRRARAGSVFGGR